jgi:hypothetical protein
LGTERVKREGASEDRVEKVEAVQIKAAEVTVSKETHPQVTRRTHQKTTKTKIVKNHKVTKALIKKSRTPKVTRRIKAGAAEAKGVGTEVTLRSGETAQQAINRRQVHTHFLCCLYSLPLCPPVPAVNSCEAQ